MTSPSNTRHLRHRWRFHDPHKGQRRLERIVEKRDAKVVIAACGRRSGKTTGLVEILARLSARRRPLAIGWFAPTYKQAKIAYRKLLWTYPQNLIVHKSEVDLELRLATETRWNFWGLDRPDNALGWGYDVAVIDEAARVSAYARDEIISPMVADNNGMVVSITSPKGRKGRGGHVWRDWKRANAKEPGYYNATAPTHDNPRPGIQKWVRFAEKNLPEDIYRQEILAEFLESGGQILDFTGVSTLEGDERHPVSFPWSRPWEPEEDAFAGLDLGQAKDYTVLGIFGADSGRMLAADRFRRLPWRATCERVRAMVKDYCRAKAERVDGRVRPARQLALYVDATGLGGPVVEMLYEVLVDLPVEVIPTVFDNLLKTSIVQGLQVATQRREIEVPYFTEAISEGETFEMTGLSSGKVQYSAAEGFHDDIVMAWGLAVLGMNRRVTGEVR